MQKYFKQSIALGRWKKLESGTHQGWIRLETLYSLDWAAEGWHPGSEDEPQVNQMSHRLYHSMSCLSHPQNLSP